MTSNAGTDLIMKLCADPDTRPEPEAFAEAVFPELLKTFKPAFLGRLTIVPYYPLADDVMRKIIHLKLGKIGKRVREHYKATFKCTPGADRLCRQAVHRGRHGARNVDHILSKTLLPEMSSEFLGRMAEGQSISAVEVSVGPDGKFVYQIS